MPTTQAHVTTLRNVSGGTKFFDFVGEHGATLTNGQDVDIPGDIFTVTAAAKKTRSLKYALENGLIEIVKSPDIFFHDATTTIVRRIYVDNGSVLVRDPDYGSYSGTAPT